MGVIKWICEPLSWLKMLMKQISRRYVYRTRPCPLQGQKAKTKWLEDTFIYEVRMIYESSFASCTGMIPEFPMMENMLVEISLLHTRNLIEFFFPKSYVHKDGVIAADFSDTPEKWLYRHKNLPKRMKKVEETVSAYVQHLSKKRISAKGWHLAYYWAFFAGEIEVFLKDLPSEYRTAKIQKFEKEFRAYKRTFPRKKT